MCEHVIHATIPVKQDVCGVIFEVEVEIAQWVKCDDEYCTEDTSILAYNKKDDRAFSCWYDGEESGCYWQEDGYDSDGPEYKTIVEQTLSQYYQDFSIQPTPGRNL